MENYNWNLNNYKKETEINNMVNDFYNGYLLEKNKFKALPSEQKTEHFKFLYTKMFYDIQKVEKKLNLNNFVDADLTCLLRKRMLNDFNMIKKEIEIFYSY